MEGNIEKRKLEKNEEIILNKDSIAEILEIEKENIIEINSEVKDVDSIKKKETKEVRVSRDNYTEEEIKNKICIICGKTNCGGIIILDKKICLECEEKAINADVKSEFYSEYKDKITKNVVGKFKNQNLG